MGRPNQEAIETFVKITGSSEAIAVQKLEEHRGDIADALDAHFNEGGKSLAASSCTNCSPGMSVAAPHQSSSPLLGSLPLTDGNQYAPLAGHPPIIENLPDVSDDVEEQMIRAAMDASIQEFKNHAAMQEMALHLQGDARAPIVGPPKSSEVELGKIASSSGRLQAVSSLFQDEAEDAEEKPLIRNRSTPLSLGSTELAGATCEEERGRITKEITTGEGETTSSTCI